MKFRDTPKMIKLKTKIADIATIIGCLLAVGIFTFVFAKVFRYSEWSSPTLFSAFGISPNTVSGFSAALFFMGFLLFVGGLMWLGISVVSVKYKDRKKRHLVETLIGLSASLFAIAIYFYVALNANWG
jgi:hypothetical protein